MILLIVTTPRGAKYCDQRVCMSVCLFVCLSDRISQEPHVLISPNVLHILSVAVARSSSDDSGIRYVLPVLRMTLCFHAMRPVGKNRRQHITFGRVRQMKAPGEK